MRDSARVRYLARHWEFDLNVPGYWKPGEHGETWTDYLGPQPYVDYTIESGSPPVIEEQMRYLAGIGVHAQEDVAQSPSAVRFLHGDLTRSTMMTTDTSAVPLARVAYTAFGDPVTPYGQGGWRVGFPAELGTRYQHNGGWGYESRLITLWGENAALPPVTLQHVGWRWYQPSIGRFVQRDPIGLKGGLNVYEYVHSSPVMRVDASGKGPRWDGFVEWVKETAKAIFIPPPIAAAEAAPDVARSCIAGWVRQPGLDGDMDEYERRRDAVYGPKPAPSAPPAPAPIDIDPSFLW